LPNPRYHIYIEYSEPDKSGVRFNITHAELDGTFSTPLIEGQPFWFLGRLLNPAKVVKVTVFWSYETADRLYLPNRENLVTAKDKKYLIENILSGKVKGAYVCTEEFLPLKLTTNSSVITPQNVASALRSKPRRIVVASGTDEALKSVTGTLIKIGLAPIIMNEEPSQGKKIVERFSDYADAGFAVVLLSPEVYVYPKGEEATKRQRSARQDVILMLGFLLGKLGKDRVLVLYKETPNFAFPKDFEGVKFTALDERGSWILALIRELTKCGYSVDAARFLK
jgi:predicted nucleotide-binding protein